MSSAASAPTVVPERSSVDPRYTWDLRSIFKSWEDWGAGFTALDQGIER